MTARAVSKPGLILLADIGATNCRLALTHGATGGATDEAAHSAVYATCDYPSPGDAIAAFLDSWQGPAPTRAALAVAAPVIGDHAQLTNQSWSFDRADLQRQFGLERVILVNDLAAQARAVLASPIGDLIDVGPSLALDAPGSIAIVGPGTGLGVARLDPTSKTPVTSTEGGHVGFAPNDDVEMELLRLWRPQLGRVTNEHIVSGPGLARLYRALGVLRDQHVEPIEGPEIMERALSNQDELCVEAADRFTKVFGAVCGDIVLAQGATSAVLVGSIANALEPILQRGGFRARFEQRGPGDGVLQTTPTRLAAAPDLGLIGARALLDDATETEQ